MKICVVALGKIGLPLAVQFASKGHEVIGADINHETVDMVNGGVEPFPGEAHLAEKLRDVVSRGLLTATTDTTAAVAQSEAVVVVVPLFAGYDLRRDVGRLFAYDVTGGRYEEREYVATGSGSLHASTVIKVGFRAAMTRDEAIDLAVRSLWEAADADSATGGPDALRGIYPIVATVTAEGWESVGDDDLAARFRRIADEVLVRTTPPAPEPVLGGDDA